MELTSPVLGELRARALLAVLHELPPGLPLAALTAMSVVSEEA